MTRSRERGRTRHAAFLRGINIGGHKPVGMQQLKKAFEELGFDEVRTVLASGNVLFRSPGPGTADLTAQIEQKVRDTFHAEIAVMVRTVAHLQALADADPFRGIIVTPETRLLVTFVARKPKPAFPVPYEPPGKGFRILKVTAGEILSTLAVSANAGTPEFMKLIEHEFGRGVTTRTWGTVLRMLRP